MRSIHSLTSSQKEKYGLYTATLPTFKMSRSKLELFMSCPRCFYLDRKCGIRRPDGYSLTLYSTVDKLLKKEFDIYRAAQKPHPILMRSGVYAIPYIHPLLEQWRDPYRGIQYAVPNTNITLTGAVDDLWLDLKTGEIIVVDYKATSWNGTININAAWQDANKRQLEVHKWLLSKNDNSVAKVAYLLYCNGRSDADLFNSQLKFEMSLVPYIIPNDSNWIEEMVIQAYGCLQSEVIPDANIECRHCSYAVNATNHNKNRENNT